jgi:GST-like protein
MIGGGTCSQLQWNASAAGECARFNFPPCRPGKGGMPGKDLLWWSVAASPSDAILQRHSIDRSARDHAMIDLYYWTTPNGHKITIFLEEAGVPYNIKPVNIGKGEQFKADFLAVSPNNRIPALVDHAPAGGGKPIAVFESGAMLLYLAEKTGQFLSRDLRARTEATQWLFWQMGNLGPMAGQNNHFNNYAVEKLQYAMDRYRNEVNRLYGVLNRRLADRAFVAGDYSIADIAIYPWIVPYERQGQKLEDFPHLKRWFEAIRARPAVERAYEKAKAVNPNAGGVRTPEERAILFGQTAASVERAAAGAR